MVVYEKIPLSDVVLRQKTRSYWVRKWRRKDKIYAATVLSMHLMCLFAPFTFSWSAFGVAWALHIVTGMLGITLSYHRNLSHKSFKLSKPLEYLFAYFGALAMQGDPIDWVSRHRYHHKYTDKDQDPHSPTEGFWFSHINWIYDTGYVVEKCGTRKNVEDLKSQRYYKFIQKTYLLHPVLLGLLLYKLGGFPFVIWGVGVRAVWIYHLTFIVNSVCHVWGKQAWNTGDFSKNNWLVAMVAFGEGWHNNHHAFEFSARHGIEWWQLDVTWLFILMLQKLGLAKDVKVPSDTHKAKMAFSQEAKTD